MNQAELINKVNGSMYHQVKTTGYATAVQTLMDVGILSKEDYERWRNGQVPYLEKVCKINLKKLAGVLEEMKRYAAKNNLKPSFTFYKQWGKKKKVLCSLDLVRPGMSILRNCMRLIM
ncbi:hypothetical protein [Butyrivibrio sp. YAB3001]|uniref:hypothetical protein n=1 Tax=Butyrivibrio sp. YAB3001 TaxID=1520812 RepID=UPI0008F64B56|nr:hypothetical protein [Butyrivibrio sp. YAB3001]SFC54566.1 hypothetical protein SAMN02910398_02512 [Butyrivibrio sp. YAB3001]